MARKKSNTHPRIEELFESLDFWIQQLLISEIPGCQLNCVDYEGVVGSVEEISGHIEAFLVLNNEVKIQRQLLERRQSFVGRKGLRRFEEVYGQ